MFVSRVKGKRNFDYCSRILYLVPKCSNENLRHGGKSPNSRKQSSKDPFLEAPYIY